MKIDLYTKGILTVIALSLVVIAFNKTPVVKDALAQSSTAVQICNEMGKWCAETTDYQYSRPHSSALKVYCVNC
jgi:hypothetical protein